MAATRLATFVACIVTLGFFVIVATGFGACLLFEATGACFWTGEVGLIAGSAFAGTTLARGVITFEICVLTPGLLALGTVDLAVTFGSCLLLVGFVVLE